MNLIERSVSRTKQQYCSVSFLTAKTTTQALGRSRSCHGIAVGTFAALLMILAGFPFCFQALAQDALGSAKVTKHNGTGACPSGGLAGGNCWDVQIWGCPQTGDTETNPFWASVKVNVPPNKATPVGFVFFTTGGGGNAYYDNFSSFITTQMTGQGCPQQSNGYNCGEYAVQTVNGAPANFTTIQTNFSDPNLVVSEPVGWLTGPAGGATDGPRAMACRYATLVHAVWTSTIINNATKKPICVTGNSAGSSAAAYALTQYGMSNSAPGPLISMVEASSGPPMGRVDHGCSHMPPSLLVNCPANTSLKEGYGPKTALQFLDPAYDGDSDLDNGTGKYVPEPLPLDPCANSIQGAVGSYPNFLHDSVVSDDYATPIYPKTFVNFVFGATDGTSAVPLGTEWYNAILSSNPSQPAPVCVSSTPHQVPSTFNGASQIAADLIADCKLY